MFGLNQISWKEFLQVILLGILSWYFVILFIAWIKSRNKQKVLYEDYQSGDRNNEALNPITVSSREFPSERIAVVPPEPVINENSFYEETGLDEGFGLDLFLAKNNPALTERLPEIQYQH